jgi:hypothetical protein
MTKKEFKSLMHHTVYTGYNGGRLKFNALYFDYKISEPQADEFFQGYKYAVVCDILNGNKADLINHMYNWIFNDINLPYYIRYKFAQEDKNRFKVGLSLNF